MLKYVFFAFLLVLTPVLSAKSLMLGVSHYTDKIVADILTPQHIINTIEHKDSFESLQQLQHDKVDMIAIQNNDAYHAYHGERRFKDAPKKNLRAIVALYPKMLAFIMKKETKLTPANVIPQDNSTLAFSDYATLSTCEEIYPELKALNSDKIVNFKQATTALLSDNIKGFFSLLGHPNQATDDLLQEHNLTLLPLYGKKFDQLKNDYPYFIKGGMPKGIYGLKKDVKSIGLKTILVTTQEMNESIVYEITKSILEKMEAFKKANPVYRGMSKKSMLEGMTIPQHKGAIKAFNAL